jgi:uncharacterized protein (TIGR03435 family)
VSFVTSFIQKLLLITPLAAVAAFAQPSAAPPAFEVATIKPAEQITPQMVQAGKMHVGMNIDKQRVDIGYMSLSDLLVTAYKVKPYQLEGPDWMKVQRFDVLATMPEGATKDDVPLMLQGLLRDRFKVEFHRDKKEHSVMALVVAKGGPKMKEAEPDPATPMEERPLAKGETQFGQGDNAMRMKQDANGASGTAENAKVGKMKYNVGADGIIHIEYGKLDMGSLADGLSQFIGTPVLDMTELKNKYQVAIEFSMKDAMEMARRNGVQIPQGAGGPPGAPASAPEASDPGSSSLLTAVAKLGLKLDSRKAPVEMIVVDSALKMPTEN